jgi:hypothetical protein
MTLQMAVMTLALFTCVWSVLLSPFVFIFGYPLGVWARRSQLAPRLGLTVLILTTIMFLTLAGFIVWLIVAPPPPPSIEIVRAQRRLLAVYLYTGGPLAFFSIITMLATLGTMFIRKIRKRSEQSVPGYPPQGVGSP